jgi:hypothetical protein
MRTQGQAVRGDDARGFLPAMLQRMQPEISQFLSLRVSVDCYDAAFVVEFIEHVSL